MTDEATVIFGMKVIASDAVPPNEVHLVSRVWRDGQWVNEVHRITNVADKAVDE